MEKITFQIVTLRDGSRSAAIGVELDKMQETAKIISDRITSEMQAALDNDDPQNALVVSDYAILALWISEEQDEKLEISRIPLMDLWDFTKLCTEMAKRIKKDKAA